ncbi:MAG: hypothetical protein WBG97_10310 [Pseudomonas sp.]
MFEVLIGPMAALSEIYKDFKWLPTAPSQDDPFNSFSKPSGDLLGRRLEVTRAVMQSTRNLPKDKFVSGAHDFSLAARHAACFAFRQYVSECHYGGESAWSSIVSLYFAGRWPVAYSADKFIVI